jgi:superfamily II DNA or RNA helicase
MILAHNKSLLKYLHDAIEFRDIAPVGYYIGGMKESELKKSEAKKIIIGTYAMASEALDIKTLTTLVMATPKTDITQAVGRILRTKDHTPLVIDFIDQHDVFLNQWKKRKSYYKKENYKIISCDSNEYNNIDYNTEYDPENKPKKKAPVRKCFIEL